jgi:hypothetical protein
MRSTYDRNGGNPDASHFLRQEADGTFTTLDVAGSGYLAFVRTNHWHGSPWHYTVDGADHVVAESSTADPDHPVEGSTFIPAAAFPPPLAVTWSTTKGADLSWVPIGFETALRLGYERTHYGTGYYIFQLVAPGVAVSDPPASWTPAQAPPDDVKALLDRAGEDIAPTGNDAVTATGTADVAETAEAATLVTALSRGPAALRALRFDVAVTDAIAFGRTRLRITWDDREEPSIDVPVALFFGTGTLYNRAGSEYLVRALPVSVRFADGRVTLAAYFPMPFQKSARIELVSTGTAIRDVAWQTRTAAWNVPANQAGYLHATYRDHPSPPRGQDLVLLDTANVEGGGAWCGSFIGTSIVFSDRAEFGTLEGDPRFFFDDSQTPQAQGTGTEEWCGGGDYWGRATMTLPFAGHPTGAPVPSDIRDPEDGIESAYRFLLADLFPFGRNARIQLEHGGENEATEHYRTVAYWYGLPGACLVPTDSLQLGDAADEEAHDWLSIESAPVSRVTSRYEWGVDQLDGQEIFPAATDDGRTTGGPTEMTLTIDPDNFGVLLRRKLDYGVADQRAEVWVADPDGDQQFVRAGIWYLAGSHRFLFSNPPEELGAAQPAIVTSDRRFRDDEMLLPQALTAGRRRIRVRLVPAPLGTPLFPGDDPQPDAGTWTAFRYDAYVWKLPAAPR